METRRWEKVAPEYADSIGTSFRKFGVALKEPRAKQAVLQLRFRTAYFVRGS